MLFRTIVKSVGNFPSITYQSKLFFIGSCFSESIGNKLVNRKFNTLNNPYGILFNPVSVARVLQNNIDNKPPKINELNYFNNRWFHFDFHSQFDAENKAVYTEKITQINTQAHQALLSADVLFITLGSAWGYQNNTTGKIVANCRKIPNTNFTKKLISVSKIVSTYTKLIKKLIGVNPQIKICFTVSPVRHWKDGVRENTISKSILHLAINELVEQFENCIYFPAYEIVMDDLRDYRFYKKDMLHPNEVAIDYIWKTFSNLFFDAATLEIIKKVEKVNNGLAHRPFHPNTTENNLFLDKLNTQIKEVEQLTTKRFTKQD